MKKPDVRKPKKDVRPAEVPAANLKAFAGAARGEKPSAMSPQELAALGRNGDSIIAHLTPGEIQVPPQVQTPQVLQTLQQAFAAKGAPLQNFIAQSPTESQNPATGQPEFGFLGGTPSPAVQAQNNAAQSTLNSLPVGGSALINGSTIQRGSGVPDLAQGEADTHPTNSNQDPATGQMTDFSGFIKAGFTPQQLASVYGSQPQSMAALQQYLNGAGGAPSPATVASSSSGGAPAPSAVPSSFGGMARTMNALAPSPVPDAPPPMAAPQATPSSPPPPQNFVARNEAAMPAGLPPQMPMQQFQPPPLLQAAPMSSPSNAPVGQLPNGVGFGGGASGTPQSPFAGMARQLAFGGGGASTFSSTLPGAAPDSYYGAGGSSGNTQAPSYTPPKLPGPYTGALPTGPAGPAATPDPTFTVDQPPWVMPDASAQNLISPAQANGQGGRGIGLQQADLIYGAGNPLSSSPNPINPQTGLRQFNAEDNMPPMMPQGGMPPQMGAPQGGPPPGAMPPPAPMGGGAGPMQNNMPPPNLPPPSLSPLQIAILQLVQAHNGGQMPPSPRAGMMGGNMMQHAMSQGGAPGGMADLGRLSTAGGMFNPQGGAPNPQTGMQSYNMADNMAQHAMRQNEVGPGIARNMPSVNPATGLPEYNIFASLLPALAGIGGAALAPMTGGASLGLSPALLAALGGAAGSGLGSALTGAKPGQIAMSAAGGGLGGAVGAPGGLGGMFGGAGGAASALPSMIPEGATALPGVASEVASQAGNPLTALASAAPAATPSGLSGFVHGLGTAVPAGIGGALGNSLGAPPASGPSLPASFSKPFSIAGFQGGPGGQIGPNGQPAPNFSGYNPHAVGQFGGFNFFPAQSSIPTAG